MLIRHNSGLWIRSGAHARQDAEVIVEVLVQDTYGTKRLVTAGGAGELVIDVGAHIGAFATAWRSRNPLADVVCVEACADNIEALTANCGHWASLIHAACTYEPGLVLYNSLLPGGTATGGSYLGPPDVAYDVKHYYRDERPLPTITLEQILAAHGKERIEVLKLDCEGSEFSILDNFSGLANVHWIVGEYHGRQRWDELRARRFGPSWRYEHVRGGDLGIFLYENRSLS